jgi:hypothetical protein
MEGRQVRKAEQRNLTSAEKALVNEHLAKQRKLQKVLSWGLSIVGLGAIFLGCLVISEAPGPALGMVALGIFVMVFPHWVTAVTRLRPLPTAVRMRARCWTKVLPNGAIPMFGAYRVEILPSWAPYWRDRVELEVDVCFLLRRKRNDVAAVFLLSLPDVP